MLTRTRENRLPELRLPKLEREEIMRILADVKRPDIHLPEVDVSKIERPRMERLRRERPRIDLSDIELPSAKDVRRTIDEVAVRAGIRERRRSPFPFVAGLAIVFALVAFALSRPAVRAQVERMARTARERMDAMRYGETMSISPGDVATPVAPSAWTDDDVNAPVRVESGDASLGSMNTGGSGALGGSDAVGGSDAIPAFEEREPRNSI